MKSKHSYNKPREKGQGVIEFILGLAILVAIILGVIWAITKLAEYLIPALGTVDTEKIITILAPVLLSALSKVLLDFLKPFFSILLTRIQRYIQSKVTEYSPKLISVKEKISTFLEKPRWYETTDAIEPGLIEVSTAVTAVLVALPTPEIPAIRILKLTVEAISIVISISMLNGYARSKGSNSHILINPFENGPLFFLGWSIVFALIFLGLVF